MGFDAWVSTCNMELGGFLRRLGTLLRKFLHVDSKLLTGSDRRMGKLLVEIDLFEGLPTR
jgi:hypothetical protein